MSIQELITRMMSPMGVPAMDKTYGFTRYKRSFTGSDAVKWLLDSSVARNEIEALTIGRAFLAKGVIFQVAHSGDFSNNYLLYQWAADRETPVEPPSPRTPAKDGIPVFALHTTDSDASDTEGSSDSESDSDLEESAIIGRKLSRRNPNRRVIFDLNKIEYDETYSKLEYVRAADYDMDTAMEQWELEEDEERERQMEVRWLYLERSLPKGIPCDERIKHMEEQDRLRKLKEEADRRAEQLREAKLAQIAALRAKKAAANAANVEADPPPSTASPQVPVLLLDREELENAETVDDDDDENSEGSFIVHQPDGTVRKGSFNMDDSPASTSPLPIRLPSPQIVQENSPSSSKLALPPTMVRSGSLGSASQPFPLLVPPFENRPGSAPLDAQEDLRSPDGLDRSFELAMYSPRDGSKSPNGSSIPLDISQFQLNNPDPQVWKQQVRDAMEHESQRREKERKDREYQAKLEIERKLREKAARKESEKAQREEEARKLRLEFAKDSETMAKALKGSDSPQDSSPQAKTGLSPQNGSNQTPSKSASNSIVILPLDLSETDDMDEVAHPNIHLDSSAPAKAASQNSTSSPQPGPFSKSFSEPSDSQRAHGHRRLPSLPDAQFLHTGEHQSEHKPELSNSTQSTPRPHQAHRHSGSSETDQHRSPSRSPASPWGSSTRLDVPTQPPATPLSPNSLRRIDSLKVHKAHQRTHDAEKSASQGISQRALEVAAQLNAQELERVDAPKSERNGSTAVQPKTLFPNRNLAPTDPSNKATGRSSMPNFPVQEVSPTKSINSAETSSPTKIFGLLSKFMSSFTSRTRPYSASPTSMLQAAAGPPIAHSPQPALISAPPKAASVSSVSKRMEMDDPANVSIQLDHLIKRFETGPKVIQETVKLRQPVNVKYPFGASSQPDQQSDNTIPLVTSSLPSSPVQTRRVTPSPLIAAMAEALSKGSQKPVLASPAATLTPTRNSSASQSGAPSPATASPLAVSPAAAKKDASQPQAQKPVMKYAPASTAKATAAPPLPGKTSTSSKTPAKSDSGKQKADDKTSSPLSKTSVEKEVKPVVPPNFTPRSADYLRKTPNLLLKTVGVDPSVKEQYLSDGEFAKEFRMSKGEFAALPQWKQQNLKRSLNFF